MYHYPTHVVLRLSTNGANGEHHWCGVINTLKYTTEVDSTCYEKQAILLKTSSTDVFRTLIFRSKYNIVAYIKKEYLLCIFQNKLYFCHKN